MSVVVNAVLEAVPVPSELPSLTTHWKLRVSLAAPPVGSLFVLENTMLRSDCWYSASDADPVNLRTRVSLLYCPLIDDVAAVKARVSPMRPLLIVTVALRNCRSSTSLIVKPGASVVAVPASL